VLQDLLIRGMLDLTGTRPAAPGRGEQVAPLAGSQPCAMTTMIPTWWFPADKGTGNVLLLTSPTPGAAEYGFWLAGFPLPPAGSCWLRPS
jgi:hypothetical protein